MTKATEIKKPERRKKVIPSENSFFLNELLGIATQILESKVLLDLGTNWDKDGAEPVDKIAYLNAVSFLKKYAAFIFKEYGKVISTPCTDLLKDGSVYINWENSSANFLIIFKKDQNQAFYYAESIDAKGSILPFNGSLYTSSAEIDKKTAIWMKNHLLAENEAQLSKYEKLENVFAGNIYVGKLPKALSFLASSISKSRFILSLLDNWDDEGSKKYAEATLFASCKFIIDFANNIYKNFSLQIDIPRIFPGPKGSIDIIWEFEKYRLVINVDANGEDATFYGDSQDQISEGQFKLANFYSHLLPIPA